MSRIVTENSISLKSNSSPNNLSIFLVFAGWWSVGDKYLTKHHLKDSLLKFWISIKPFLGWFNSNGITADS